MEEDVFEIENVLNTYEEKNKVYYLVRWKGYGEDADTWEPEENLDGCEEVLKVFWNSSKKKNAKKGRKGKRGRKPQSTSAAKASTQQKKQKQPKNGSVESNNNCVESLNENSNIEDKEEVQEEITEDFAQTWSEIGTGSETCAPKNALSGEIDGHLEDVFDLVDTTLDSLYANVLPESEAAASQGQPGSSEKDINQETLSESCFELNLSLTDSEESLNFEGCSESPTLCEAGTSCVDSSDWCEIESGTCAQEGECLTGKNDKCPEVAFDDDCNELLKEAPVHIFETSADGAARDGVLTEETLQEVLVINSEKDNFEKENHITCVGPSVSNTDTRGLQDIEEEEQIHQTLNQECLSEIMPSRCEMKDDDYGLTGSSSLVKDRTCDQLGDDTAEDFSAEDFSADIIKDVFLSTDNMSTVLENVTSCATDHLGSDEQKNKLLNQKEEHILDVHMDSCDNSENIQDDSFSEQDKIDAGTFDQFENNPIPEPSKPEISKLLFDNLLKMKKKISLKPLSTETKSKWEMQTSDEVNQKILLTNDHNLSPTNKSHSPKHLEEFGDLELFCDPENASKIELDGNGSPQLPAVEENCYSEDFEIEKPDVMSFLGKRCFLEEEDECADHSPISPGIMNEDYNTSPSYSLHDTEELTIQEDFEQTHSPISPGIMNEDYNTSPSYSLHDTEELAIQEDFEQNTLHRQSPAFENFAQQIETFPQKSVEKHSAEVFNKDVPTCSEFRTSASTSLSSGQRSLVDFQYSGGDSDIEKQNKQLSVISISDNSESRDYNEVERNKRRKTSTSFKKSKIKHSYHDKGKNENKHRSENTSWKRYPNKKQEDESGSSTSYNCDVVSKILESSSLKTHEVNDKENHKSHGKYSKEKRHNDSDMELSDSDFEFDLDDYNPTELVIEKVPKVKIDVPVQVGIPSAVSLGDVKKAIKRGESATVLASLAGGLDIESTDGVAGMTLLMRAACTGQDGMVKLLISHGANVNAKDNTGNTPLMFACEQGFETIASLLLDVEADVNAKQSNGGETALIKACKKGHYPVVSLLVSYGADCQMRGQSGLTASQWAAQCGYFEIRDLLTAHNKRLQTCVENAIISCLGHANCLISPPLLPYVCLYPNEGQKFTYHFNCSSLLSDKTVLLFCFRAVFSRSGNVNVSFSTDNGVQSISLNGVLQSPMLKNNRSVFKLHPKVDTNRLSLQTYHSHVHLLVNKVDKGNGTKTTTIIISKHPEILGVM